VREVEEMEFLDVGDGEKEVQGYWMAPPVTVLSD